MSALAALVIVVSAFPRPAVATTSVTLDARVDGRPVREATETRPIRLDPDRPAVLSVEVVNPGSSVVTVRTVRLEGVVMGLTFFAYDTAVGMVVPAGGRSERRFELDLAGLGGQAIGLIPGSVTLLDADRDEVASEPVVVDVRGSLLSVYGAFGLAVAFLTVLSFLGALVGLARHRLPPNRWRRALRFLTPGIGLGLVLNFTLSATRVYVPRLGRWTGIVAACAVVLFVVGYLTPSPEEEGEEEALALVALPAGTVPGALTAAPVAELPDAGGRALPPPGTEPPGGPATSP
jgi:hypothetical protein